MVQPYVVLNAATADAVGKSIFCKDAQHIIVTVASANLGVGKSFIIKIKGSSNDDAPTFSSAKSASNPWDYIQAIRQSDGSVIDGATGDTFSATDDVRQYEVNTNGLTWVTVDLSSLTGASVTCTAKITLHSED